MILPFLLAVQGLHTEKPGWWTLDVAFPRFASRGAVARTANAASAKRERKWYADFLADAKREMPAIKAGGGLGSYELDIAPHRTTDRPTAVSGYVEIYVDTAGAHPTNLYEAVNYGKVGGQVRALRLRDLFRPGKDAVGECSRALLAEFHQAPADERPGDVVSGEWTRLTPKQAEQFAFGKLGILFLFGRYDIGPGVEGSSTVLVPWSRLPGAAPWVRTAVR